MSNAAMRFSEADGFAVRLLAAIFSVALAPCTT